MTDGVTDAVSSAMAGASDESDPVKAAVGAAAAMAAVPPPSTPTAISRLWTILVSGLVFALLVALGGVLYTVADGKDTTSPDVMVTVFTALLTGLIGLFVKSPTQ